VQTFGLVIAFVLVSLSALVAVGVAAGVWFAVKAARPELLRRGPRGDSAAG